MNKIFLTLFLGVILLFQVVTFGNYQTAEAAENIDVAVYQASSFECENGKHCFEWWLDYVEDSWRRVPGSVQVQYLDPDAGWISRDVQLFSGVGKVLIVVDKKINQAKIIGFVEPNTRAKYVGDGDLLTFGSFRQSEFQTTDETPPVLNVPENIVQSTAAESALVLFSVTAVDDTDVTITPVCSHESGDLFPIGMTTVTCSATDSAGNSVNKTFTITIKRWAGSLGHGVNPGVPANSGEIVDDIIDDFETKTKSTRDSKILNNGYKLDVFSNSIKTLTSPSGTITKILPTGTEIETSIDELKLSAFNKLFEMVTALTPLLMDSPEDKFLKDSDGTTYFKAADGSLEYLKNPDGSYEFLKTSDGFEFRAGTDGSEYLKTSDGTIRWIFPDGSELIKFPDGTESFTLPDKKTAVIVPEDTKIIELPNGQTIIPSFVETSLDVLPDGTKIVTLPDGSKIKVLSDTTNNSVSSILGKNPNKAEMKNSLENFVNTNVDASDDWVYLVPSAHISLAELKPHMNSFSRAELQSMLPQIPGWLFETILVEIEHPERNLSHSSIFGGKVDRISHSKSDIESVVPELGDIIVIDNDYGYFSQQTQQQNEKSDKPETTNDLGPISKTVLPPQQKQVFKWWADGLVSDEEMMNSITYMFEAEIITSDKIEITEFESDDLGPIKKSTFPPQQKQVLQWWAEGLVSDEEVMNNITYLFETKTLQSGKIKIKNDGLAKVTPIDPSTINPYDGLPFAEVIPDNSNGLAKVTPIDPNSNEWIDFEKYIIKRTYESQKWHEAIAKKLVGIKDSQAKVLDDAQRQITSIYAQDGNPAVLNELVEIKDAVKKVNDEALQAVKFLSKIKDQIAKTESIATDAGIHTSELADAASEQQEIIDSVIPELGTKSDFKDAYEDIDKTTTSAFSDLEIKKLMLLGGKSNEGITEKETRSMFMYSFETEGEIETVARTMLSSPGYKDMPYDEILETLRGHELEKIVKDQKFRQVYDELKTKNQKTFADSESVIDELGGIIIDYGSPYGYDPKTGKPYDPPPKKGVLILQEYKLNDVENEKVLDVLTPGFLDSFKIDPLTSDEPRIAQDMDIDEDLIEDTTSSQDDEPNQETTPAHPEEPVTGDAALYRLVSKYDHFYTTDVNEKNNAYGYTFERIEAYVFSTQETGTVPFYRLFNGLDHFYLIDSAERSTAMSLYGYVDEGIEGYVYATQEPGTVPLYRLVGGGNHFYTTDLTEKNNAVAYLGYVDEGIECYVFPNN